MDQVTTKKQSLKENQFSTTNNSNGSVAEMVRELLEYFTSLWWTCEPSFPTFKATLLPEEQAQNEKRLDQLVSGLGFEFQHIPQTPEDRRVWQERLRPGMDNFLRMAFHLDQHQMDFIESSSIFEASQEFACMARAFDPDILGEDIYQAGRNVMSANLIQLLLDLPVKVTPSIFAYSMLYPYTDNYLDDPSISSATKLDFNQRFERRLHGEEVPAQNQHEEMINQLLSMIESQWKPKQFPQVYESLLAIHSAQARSLGLIAPGASPFELDVLGITFEKGGTAVLADGYLAAGQLSPQQARMLFGYGLFTQLMDDLEDIKQDLSEGCMTLFSQTVPYWPLDNLTNRIFHFRRAIFDNLNSFNSKGTSTLKELVSQCLDPLLIDIVGRAGNYYSRAYMREMEQHISFRFAALKKQRKKLGRQKIGIGKLVETILLMN